MRSSSSLLFQRRPFDQRIKRAPLDRWSRAEFSKALSKEAHQALHWVPILLAIGVSIYFTRPLEPSIVQIGLIGALGSLGLVFAYFWRFELTLALPCFSIGLICIGIAATGGRTYAVAAPVLETRYYGPVEGRVTGLDRSSSGALRVTLSDVWLGTRPAHRTPHRVRISLYGPDAEIRPVAGAYVMTTAHLSPPNGPAEPGGFDFQRHAWFQALGGVGYTRHPLLLVERPEPPAGFFGLRLALSERVQSHLADQTGAFAAALMSGDRSALSQKTLRDLRQTNLAHLLAISGLHMGLLVGTVFAALKIAFTLTPALRNSLWSARFAALGAMGAAAIYLGLSGGSVATERAFIMAMVGLGAVLLGRRVISLRAVALAATLLLLWQPESLLSPGFQMSFAATTALVVVFRRLVQLPRSQGWKGRMRTLLEGAIVSSAVAGLATLPVAMAHFNQIAHYGLIANVISVPLMGIWIMPFAILSVLLMPIGLEGLPLWAMGLGLDYILHVAGTISQWPGAISKITSPPTFAFATFMAGCLGFAVMRTSLRLVALPLIAIGALGWASVERPDILISDEGQLVGVKTATGRALSRGKGASFVASIWLENDGDPSQQWQAAQRWGTQQTFQSTLGASNVIHVRGKRGLDAFSGCQSEDIVVFNSKVEETYQCDVYDPKRLAKTGAVAVFVEKDGTYRTVAARQLSGQRVWNSRQLRRHVSERFRTAR